MTPVAIIATLVTGAAVAWAGFCVWAALIVIDLYDSETD